MATSQMSEVIEHLRRTMLLRDGAGLTDGQLLEDYISRRDQAALAALVRRHGPMVWGVCRRVLRNLHDAEDAFQATFLVLVRKAASIVPRQMVANWLYGVAHQTAANARATAARRRQRERQVTEMPEPAITEQNPWNGHRPLLDEELSRLPDKYRAVIILCDLEGKTRKEAAGQIGVPEGTVAGWLARARAMLARRLTRRGVALSGGAVAAVLSQQAASAGVPTAVLSSTIKAVTLLAAGQAAAAGATSVKAAALTEGVLKAMLMSQLKAVIAVVLVLGFLATGATILACRTAAGQQGQRPVAERPMEPTAKHEQEKDEGIVTAWGQEVGGLQAGLGFRPGERRAYHPGETVKLVVRVRNVGKEEVQFQYLRHFFIENPPAVVDDKGKPVPLKDGTPKGIYEPVDVSLAPGKEIELYELNLGLSEKSAEVAKDSTLYGSGKFRLQYGRVLGDSSLSSVSIKFDPVLKDLGTGKLELEVKAGAKVRDDKAKEEKEGFTAWGQEVGGLQAGLGLRPGERRAYHHGETITLVVRVRNVGKEAVKFEYLRQFLDENPPTVTDADGKTVPQVGLDMMGMHGPVEVSLGPGKEIELESRLAGGPRLAGASGLRYELRPALGTGKISFQYERVLGNSSAGSIKLDPTLSKLATGKLELEVRASRNR
jgi:RNA polymerase sigma factor (sigma-70 family)